VQTPHPCASKDDPFGQGWGVGESNYATLIEPHATTSMGGFRQRMSPKPQTQKREREWYPSPMDPLYRLPQSSQRLDLGALSIVTMLTEGYLD